MNTPVVKIVLDTNVLIAIIGRTSPYRWIFDSIISGVSNEILFEYHEVFEQKTTPEIAENIMQFLSSSPFISSTEIFFNWNLIRVSSEKDNHLIINDLSLITIYTHERLFAYF